jgi:hypothetical protein
MLVTTQNNVSPEQLVREVRGLWRCCFGLALLFFVVIATAASPLVEAVFKRVEVRSDDGRRTVRLTPGVVDADVDVRLGGTSLKDRLKSIENSSIKFDMQTLIIRGATETSSTKHFHKQFVQNGSMQMLEFPIPDRRKVIAAWPVVLTHNVPTGNFDIQSSAYKHYWKDWQGDLSVGFSTNRLVVGGNVQLNGMYLIDVAYLYTDD